MRHSFTALTAILLAASSVHGAVLWTPPAGTTSTFSFANGQDDTGGLGSGMAYEPGFYFTPASFRAVASEATTASASDVGSVDVTAAAGLAITGISASIFGDYSILGIGSASSIATITVTNLDAMSAPVTQPIVFSGLPAATVTAAGGNFTGVATLTLPPGWTHVHLSLNDGMTATAGAASTAFIQTTEVDLGVTTGQFTAGLPEPTSALALSGLALFVRRSRR